MRFEVITTGNVKFKSRDVMKPSSYRLKTTAEWGKKCGYIRG